MIQIEFVDGPLDGVVETLPDERGLTRELVVQDTHYLAWDAIVLRDDVYVQYVAYAEGPDAIA